MNIHLGWVGSEPPQAIVDAVEAVRAASPGCDVMFHTDESMVPSAWRDVAQTLRPQMRSDVQRHCILRKYGGLWLDADVRVLRDPAEWAAGWNRYTAIKFGALTATDIIYVPPAWDAWPVVEAHMNRVLAEIVATKRVRLLALASRMIDACRLEQPDAFQVIDDPLRFPVRPSQFTIDSVVARGFDPPATPLPAPPSLLTKAKNFAVAAATHVAAGMTQASDEELARRFAICQQCEHFDGTACRQCGCGVSRERAFVSKLSWSTSSCPVGKWGRSPENSH